MYLYFRNMERTKKIHIFDQSSTLKHESLLLAQDNKDALM